MNYFRKHRHCPYAVVLAYNIPADGEATILETLENPDFRVYKTITALKRDSSRKDVQAYLKSSLAENAARLAQEFRIESEINTVRNQVRQHTLGLEPPRLSNPFRDIQGRQSIAPKKTDKKDEE